MRLLVRVRAAISSMRAPLSPSRANSSVATSMMSALVRSATVWTGSPRGSDIFVRRFLSAFGTFAPPVLVKDRRRRRLLALPGERRLQGGDRVGADDGGVLLDR